MTREYKVKVRTLSDIRSLRELRKARHEFGIASWYAGERLAENAGAVFSFDNLLSLAVPQGSVLDRAFGGVSTGAAVVRGIWGVLRRRFWGC